MTATFVVVQVLLQGLVELQGADLLADRLLHVAVPGLAALAWTGDERLSRTRRAN